MPKYKVAVSGWLMKLYIALSLFWFGEGALCLDWLRDKQALTKKGK